MFSKSLMNAFASLQFFLSFSFSFSPVGNNKDNCDQSQSSITSVGDWKKRKKGVGMGVVNGSSLTNHFPPRKKVVQFLKKDRLADIVFLVFRFFYSCHTTI